MILAQARQASAYIPWCTYEQVPSAIMKNILLSLLCTFPLAPALTHAIVPPGASTPEFYLIASAQSSPGNLLVRLSVRHD
jgi:hypothetical protein